jgi:hypothetical protein
VELLTVAVALAFSVVLAFGVCRVVLETILAAMLGNHASVTASLPNPTKEPLHGETSRITPTT